MKTLEQYEIMPIIPMQPVSDPQMSTDGSRVLFTYTKVNIEEDRYQSNIWIVSPNGGEPQRFTSGSGKDTTPRWSPDKRHILFLSDRTTGKGEEEKKGMQIWVMPVDGGEARCLTDIEGGVGSPEWSPDGRRIMFISKVFKGEKAEGSDVTIIRRIDYKWDGRGIFDGERTHLFTVSLEDGEVVQLTDGGFDVSDAVWSPDGTRIAFISGLKPSSDVMRALYFENIYTIPASGGEPEVIWAGEKWDVGRPMGLSWSPDGEMLAFAGRIIGDLSQDVYKNSELWVISSRGGEPTNLTSSFDRSVRMYSSKAVWSHDSKSIHFTAPDHGSVNLYKVDVDSRDVISVTNEKFILSSFTLDELGSKIVFVATDELTPHELWVKDDKGVRRLTTMNQEYTEYTLSEPEEFWTKTSEGLDIHGWIMKPHDFKEGVKYPAILSIHGGPHGMYGYSFNHEFQVFANHGYVVIYTNPRASTGYGEAFAAPVYGLWGELDSKDILEALDHALKKYPFIDPDRMGVTGLSYGGYMTNWLIGHTDRFKAAVSRNSLTNMYSAWGTSDIGWMGYEISRVKTPWDDSQFYLEQSPIHYIKNIKTPLLLTHCEKDHRCPMEQSEQLYTGLKRLGREVEFVRFPGESHVMIGIGKPKHRMERIRHILRWFNRYIERDD